MQRMGIRERTQAAIATLPSDEEWRASLSTEQQGAEELMPPSERLIKAVERLVHPDGMGTVYKAMAIVPKALVSPDAPGVIGFPDGT